MLESEKVSETALEFEAVSFSYSRTAPKALTNVSFAINRGEFVVLAGKPGAGKTTLCRSINGLIPQAVDGIFEGTVTTLGMKTTQVRIQTITGSVGFVMDDPDVQIVGRTVFEDTAFGLRNFLEPLDVIKSRVSKTLDVVGLNGFEKRLTHTLSGGEKQRLAIAGILAMEPEMIILDDALTEIDPLGCGDLYRIFKNLQEEKKVTVLIVENDPWNLPFLPDRIIVLEKGSSEKGSISEIFNKEGLRTGFDDFKKHLNVSSSVKSSRKQPSSYGKPVLEVKGLDYSIGDTGILNDISFSVRGGEFIGIAGPNGAGKTTLLKHLCGLLPSPPGTIFLHDKELNEYPYEELFRFTGIVFQNPDYQIFNSTVEKELDFGMRNQKVPKEQRRKKITEILSSLGLMEHRATHPHALSKGWRQIIACASVICMEPDVLLMDEPASGLDEEESEKVMQMVTDLNKKGKTVMMISHDVNLLDRYANRIFTFKQGNLVSDYHLPVMMDGTACVR